MEVESDAGHKVCVCVLEPHFIVQSVLRPSVHPNLIRCFCSNLGAVCLCLCVCVCVHCTVLREVNGCVMFRLLTGGLLTVLSN